MRKWAIAAICFTTIVAALALTLRIRLDKIYAVDGPATQAAVLKIIPIGSKMEFAKATMEARRFTCGMEYNKKYSGDDPAGGQIDGRFPLLRFRAVDRPNSVVAVASHVPR